MQASRLRLARVLKHASSAFVLDDLAPRSRYGAPEWQRELLELYDMDSVARLQAFLRSVRWTGMPSSSGGSQGLFEGHSASLTEKLSSRAVLALNYCGRQFESVLRVVLLQDVAALVGTKLLVPDLEVWLWQDARVKHMHVAGRVS